MVKQEVQLCINTGETAISGGTLQKCTHFLWIFPKFTLGLKGLYENLSIRFHINICDFGGKQIKEGKATYLISPHDGVFSEKALATLLHVQ